MSLSLMNPLPDTERRIRELTQALEAADQRGDRLEVELKAERRKNASVEKGVVELRKILSPLYQALGMVFGQVEVMGVTDSRDYAPAPKANAAWESWKQKVGGLAARAIDVLLLHGELNRTQLRLHLSCATRSITDVVYKLNQAGLINKNGGKISLKEL